MPEVRIQQHTKLSDEDLKLFSQVTKFRELVKDQALLVTQMDDSALKTKTKAELEQMQDQLRQVMNLQRQRLRPAESEDVSTADTRKQAGAQLKSFFLDTFKLPFTQAELEQIRHNKDSAVGPGHVVYGDDSGSRAGAKSSGSGVPSGDNETKATHSQSTTSSSATTADNEGEDGAPGQTGVPGQTPASGGAVSQSDGTATPQENTEPGAVTEGDHETVDGPHKVMLVCDAVTKSQCEAYTDAERAAVLASVQKALRVASSSDTDLIAEASIYCGSIVISGYATNSVFGLINNFARCDHSQLTVDIDGASLSFCMTKDTGTDAAAVAASAASLATSPIDAAVVAAGEDLEAKIASTKAKLEAAIAAGDDALAASLRKKLKKLRDTQIAKAKDALQAAIAVGDEATAANLHKGIAVLETMEAEEQGSSQEPPAPAATQSPEQARVDALRERVAEAQRKIDAAIAAGDQDRANSLRKGLADLQDQLEDAEAAAAASTAETNETRPYIPPYAPNGTGTGPNFTNQTNVSPDTFNETESWTGSFFDEGAGSAGVNMLEIEEVEEMDALQGAGVVLDNATSAQLASLDASAASNLERLDNDAQEKLAEINEIAEKAQNFVSVYDAATSGNASEPVDVSLLESALLSLSSPQTMETSTKPQISGSTKASLELPMDISEIPDGSEARDAFEKNFQQDVARNLGVDLSRITLSTIHAGSVVVEFYVLPDLNGQSVKSNLLISKLAVGAQIAGRTLVSPVTAVEVIEPTEASDSVTFLANATRVSDLQQQLKEGRLKFDAALSAGLTDRAANLQKGLDTLQRNIHDATNPTAAPVSVLTTGAPYTVSVKSQIASAKAKIKKAVAVAKGHGLSNEDKATMLTRVESLRAGLHRLEELLDTGTKEMAIKAPVPSSLKEQVIPAAPPETSKAPSTEPAPIANPLPEVTSPLNQTSQVLVAELNPILQAKIDHAKARLNAALNDGNTALAKSLRQGIDNMELVQKEQAVANSAAEYPAAAPLTPLVTMTAPGKDAPAPRSASATMTTATEVTSDVQTRIDAASQALQRATALGNTALAASLQKGLSRLKVLQANGDPLPQQPIKIHDNSKHIQRNVGIRRTAGRKHDEQAAINKPGAQAPSRETKYVKSQSEPSEHASVEDHNDVEVELERQISEKKVSVIEAMKRADDAESSGADAATVVDLHSKAVSLQKNLAQLRISHATVKVTKALSFAQSPGLSANERLMAEAHAVSLQRGLANLKARKALLDEGL
eukprot:SAG31_NODE_2868_length_4977_cov_80.358754_2_plen_1258_part_00